MGIYLRHSTTEWGYWAKCGYWRQRGHSQRRTHSRTPKITYLFVLSKEASPLNPITTDKPRVDSGRQHGLEDRR